ncbi:MAG: histidine triad nucleotide-binding protein [Ruminococcaceae bacterium]|nr:histidine triad nucleotide-binding protein [Oscillospiraceae bacterium]MBQ2915322.1 histidine triad nucleotide-binding protein [Clostridia bacterium]
MDCIFCKIVAGEIPCSKVYEDEKILAFKDINPQAPVHVIFIPKQHILTCADDINDSNKEIIGDIFAAISKVAKELGLADGYRIINNCGKHGAQSVKHIHFHLLGGAQLPEDMGVRE